MQLPARIGKYELEEFLGGGMSEVYRARDTIIGRTVALKILSDKGREDGEVKARFLAEARTAGNISHENILGIYDFGEDDQHRPFIVMEFLRGEDLRHAIKGGRTGDLRNRLRIALQIARALEYIHGQKIIHRDLKPENVHITATGQVKLMDFGISKREGLEMTRTGFIVGTPYYMAPEQVTGAQITLLADVYAFGILLYELIAGRHPVVGETMERLFYAILNEPLKVEPLRQCGTPEAVCQLVARCAAKNPAERPQGFGEVCAELERLIAAQEEFTADQNAPTVIMPERQAAFAAAPPAPAAAPMAKQSAEAPPRRRFVLLGAGGIAVLALGVVLFVARPSHQEAPSPPPPPAVPATQADMVLVPAGTFLSGEKKQQRDLRAFYIDKTEVTNAAYKAFCDATSHPLPPDFPNDKPDYPVMNVTIDDAKAYAEWKHERLPTALEWEKAARGTDGRLYPWGNQPDAARANVAGTHLSRADDFPGSASPYGALQMVGNAWELVDAMATPSDSDLKTLKDKLDPPPTEGEPWVQIRGGSYNQQLEPGLVWDFSSIPARWRNADIGFRCVKDAR